MYNVSAQYLECALSTARTWDLYIEVLLKNGVRLTLTKEDLKLNATKLTESATCSESIQVGSTYANSFECTIMNTKGQYTENDFHQAILCPYAGLDITGDEDFEYVPLGKFRVLENVKNFSTIPLVGFDDMTKLNKTFQFGHIVFPTNCITVFNELMSQCDIEYDTSIIAEIEALPYEINSLLTNDPTCRDILAGLGLMLQKNFRFNRLGVLETFWYVDTGVSTDPNTRVGNSTYGDNIINVSGVYLEDAYGNVFSVGTEEYAVELPSSPIIQGRAIAIPVLEAALAKFQALEHRPSTITFIGDPAIQAGDILQHNNTAVGSIQLPVMRSIYKFAGTGTLECLGAAEEIQNQQTATSKNIKKAFQKSAQDRAELETKISQTADTVLLEVSEKFTDKQTHASLALKVDGINAEVAQKTKEIDSVKENITSIQQSANQVSVQIQEIVDNGVSKVTTATGYTFDADGLVIQKSGTEMQNRLNHTGMYVERSGETILQANNSGVIAADVTVRNYLTVGTHARFEDYYDGLDSSRTACFYVL